MKIPEKIKIGGNNFKISRGSYRGEFDRDGGALYWETNDLYLANDMPEDREATCFLHEILHGLNIYLTEEQATYISEGLIQIIRDNNLDFRKESNGKKSKKR